VNVKRAFLVFSLLAATAGGAIGSGKAYATVPTNSSWGGCCGVRPWKQGRGAIKRVRGTAGTLRNGSGLIVGIPSVYAGLHNPLPRTRATITRGAEIYDHYCAACHGNGGLGNGPAGRKADVPPANLAMLSRMPISRWDAFMYWTVTEGGAPLHTAMPAFKNSLPANSRWAVIAYIQARLPRIGG